MRKFTDFHTHILPCMDDGSVSPEMSLEMLKKEAEQGIGTVVATPHFYADREDPKSFLARRDHSEKMLVKALGEKTDGESLPSVELGAEVHFFDGISECEELEALSIGKTGFVMIEMPFRKWSDRMLLELDGISKKRKIVPIVAHIDRYIGAFGGYVDPTELAELNVRIQANASFLLKLSTRKKALSMLGNGYIHVLGSDTHDTEKRSPCLGKALSVIERSLGATALDRLNEIENEILNK